MRYTLAMTPDGSHVFARILKGEIPCRAIFENDSVLAFHDIHPKAPVHALVIPKNSYQDATDFHTRGTDEEIAAFYRACAHVVHLLELMPSGYRLISNCGPDSGQEVPHFHMHILGGGSL